MLSHKSRLEQLEKEFLSQFDIHINKTYPEQERSKIVERLTIFCGDEKKDNKDQYRERQYHLYKLLQQSLKSFNEEKHKKQVKRTIKLFDDCVITLQTLAAFTQDEFTEEAPILDFRKPLKIPENKLEEEIFKKIATDEQFNMFIRGPHYAIEGARVLDKVEEKGLLNTTAILEYATLCHALEDNQLLLDLDLEFLCNKKNLSDQILYIKSKAGTLLKSQIGIKILNIMGYDKFCEEDSQFYLYNFVRMVEKIEDLGQILDAYNRILKFLTLDFIEKNHKLMMDALIKPEKMKELIFSNPEFLNALINGSDRTFVKNYIPHKIFLRELKIPETVDHALSVSAKILPFILNVNGYTLENWLELLGAVQQYPEFYRVLTEQFINKFNIYSSLEKWLTLVDPKYQLELFQLLESLNKPLNYYVLYKNSEVLKASPKIKNKIIPHKDRVIHQIKEQYNIDDYNLDHKLIEFNKSILKEHSISSVPKPQIFSLGASIFSPLHFWVEGQIQQKNKKRAEICMKVKNDDFFLLELLGDLDVLNNLSENELLILFENGNKALFAEVMIRAYPGRPFSSFMWKGKQVDLAFLQQFVPLNESISELNRCNAARAEYQIPQLIPQDVIYPYTKYQDSSEDSPYSLQDQDIAAGEEILLEQKSVKRVSLIKLSVEESGQNKELTGIEYDQLASERKSPAAEKVEMEKPEEKKIESSVVSTLKKLYLAPMIATEAVLIDPKVEKHQNLRNYREFKKNLALMTGSINFEKSAVLTGICNLTAGLYVPFFIYKNTKGVISVLTINPSLEPSPILEACFKDIFPHCHYADAHIPQALTPSDFGFTALESIRVAALSMYSKTPLISIVDDVMKFDPQSLTINSELFRGYDYIHKQPYFLSGFNDQLKENRENWTKELRAKKQIRHTPQTLEDYCYDDNVKNKKKINPSNGFLSYIAALIVSENLLDEYRKQYQQRLELPTPIQIEIIRLKLQEAYSISKPVEEIRTAIYNVYKMNYKENTKEGLINFFRDNFLKKYAITKDAKSVNIIQEFKTTSKYVEYHKLLSGHELTDFFLEIRKIVEDLIQVSDVSPRLKLSKSSDDFYKEFLAEAKCYCTAIDLQKISKVTESLSFFDQFNPFMSSSLETINLSRKFKEAVANARKAVQMEQFLKYMITVIDKPIDDIVAHLAKWSTQKQQPSILMKPGSLY